MHASSTTELCPQSSRCAFHVSVLNEEKWELLHFKGSPNLPGARPNKGERVCVCVCVCVCVWWGTGKLDESGPTSCSSPRSKACLDGNRGNAYRTLEAGEHSTLHKDEENSAELSVFSSQILASKGQNQHEIKKRTQTCWIIRESVPPLKQRHMLVFRGISETAFLIH
jgi:hypothetical protein